MMFVMPVIFCRLELNLALTGRHTVVSPVPLPMSGMLSGFEVSSSRLAI